MACYYRKCLKILRFLKNSCKQLCAAAVAKFFVCASLRQNVPKVTLVPSEQLFLAMKESYWGKATAHALLNEVQCGSCFERRLYSFRQPFESEIRHKLLRQLVRVAGR